MIRVILTLVIALGLSACGSTSPLPIRIVLFAPFEGREREIGYQALYASRLAWAEYQPNVAIELVAIDTGETVQGMIQRANAIARDPQTLLTLVLGEMSSTPDVLHAFGDVPVIVGGYWGANVSENTFILAPETIVQLHQEDERYALESQAITGIHLLNEGEPQIIVSSGHLPDADFTTRYLAMDVFAPPPTLVATLAYQATEIALQAVDIQSTRTTVMNALTDDEFITGYGTVQFTNHYAHSLDVHFYEWRNGELVDVTDMFDLPVE